MCANFFIITGGPGAGKTTLVEELTKRGLFCVEEASRKIIRREVASGGDALPWKNIALYTEKLLTQSVESYNEAINVGQNTVIFDRGILDYINYAYRAKTRICDEWQSKASSLVYNKKIFVTPPWKEIYCNDSERKQTFEDSLWIYSALIKMYSESGYELIELPKASVEKRADFLISHIGTLY